MTIQKVCGVYYATQKHATMKGGVIANGETMFQAIRNCSEKVLLLDNQ